MSKVKRFGVSLEKDLLNNFDRLIKKKKYTNRSEALRDLIRNSLVENDWKYGKEVAGIITVVYDHHKRELVNTFLDIQHDFHHLIISTQHIHLDRCNCMETIIVKGNPKSIQKLSDSINSIRGIKHSTINITTTGKTL